METVSIILAGLVVIGALIWIKWRFAQQRVEAAGESVPVPHEVESFKAELAHEDNGQLSLHFKEAVLKNMPSKAQAALELGAKPDAMIERGGNMIRPSASLLEEAVWANAAAIVELMLEAGADPNLVHQTKKHSPLHQASKTGQTSLAELLLAQGADVDLVAQQGLTALHAAIANGNLDIVRLLLKAGADPELTGPQDGLSPLERAQAFSTDRWSNKRTREACEVMCGVLEAAIAASPRAQGSET